MRNKKFYIVFTLIFFSLLSCKEYLNHEVDQQLTFEKTFSKRIETERFLAGVYSYLPSDMVMLDNFVGASDEAYFMWDSWGVKYLNHNNGSWNPTSSDYHIWTSMYRGINQATIFIENVDANIEISDQTKVSMKAEARFLRAYYYFLLLRQYGPVFIWGDKSVDMEIKPDEVDRHSYEACAEFISSEFLKAAADLPNAISDSRWFGKATKGAALAANSRLALYSARPLFNGASLYRGMKNSKGEFLFPHQAKTEKWEEAAKAAKAVIDMNMYKLQVSTKGSNAMEKAIESYSEILFEPWNREIIFGKWNSTAEHVERRASPWGAVSVAFGGFSPSLKLVDTYPMAATGRYPITGYESNGSPKIDPLSGYNENGFTDNFNNPADTIAAHTFKAHNSVVGRDARFYASILFNGMYWINTYKGSRKVYFQRGGNGRSSESDYNKSGYLFRRLVNPANDIESLSWGKFSWPFFRLAEVYLNYAEACNEKPNRNESEALLYLNKIRERSNLNKVEEAYPEVLGNKQLLREIIRKERMVELAFENHRYFDIRTWMIADTESNGARYGRNQDASTYETAWERTKHYTLPIVFESKHYLFPIHQNQLNEMKSMTQNYGW